MMKQFLEAGAHFGHRTRKWNPKMAPYIHSERNGIHIIDLRQTVRKLQEACALVYKTTQSGKDIMFVGTKKQSRDVIREKAIAVDSPFVCERWLGGMLTNHETIRQSIKKLINIEEMEEDGTINLRPKKEVLKLRKLRERLKRNLEGIQNMKNLPNLLVVVDVGKESIAVAEARILGIPVIGIVDTNCDPSKTDICIPSNDDAIKASGLILEAIGEAVRRGKAIYAQKVAEEQARIEEERALKKKEQEQRKKLQEEKAYAAEIARKDRETEKKAQQEKLKQENLKKEQKESANDEKKSAKVTSAKEEAPVASEKKETVSADKPVEQKKTNTEEAEKE
ncbi:30S ribosomal protein S2 [PVC group bacterium (ex Bugula neritina AB1)]|nr:30S ribosomal protein S2 [PVC group bacterium (ex Bugula neritina AB1)]